MNTAMLDAEEEDDYFNASDDEDFMTASSPPAAPQSPPIMAGMKRKRANRIPVLINGSGSLSPSASGNYPRQRQQTSGGIVLPSPYPIKLVDYDDAEDDPSSPRDSATPPPSSPEPHEGSANKPSKIPTPAGGLMRTRSTTNLAMTNGTGKSVNGSPSASPKSLRPDSPPRLSEKRRREEDEDDMLGNLSSGSQKNAKKQAGPKPGATSQPDNTTTNPNRATSPPSATGIAGGIAKRIKLSLGKSGFGMAAHVPVTTPQKKEEEMSK